MKQYRDEARKAYRDRAHIVTLDLFHSDNLPGWKLCKGLQQRLAVYNEMLIVKGILTHPDISDPYLCDMEKILSSAPFNTEPNPVQVAGIDKDHRCEGHCRGCSLRVGEMAFRAVEDLMWGAKEHCTACFECFEEGVFNFIHECVPHNPWWH